MNSIYSKWFCCLTAESKTLPNQKIERKKLLTSDGDQMLKEGTTDQGQWCSCNQHLEFPG